MPSYSGTVTTTGSSQAVRLDKDFFRHNPEFSQKAKVRASIIAPGMVLVSVVGEPSPEEAPDPVLEAFLAFLGNDMAQHPERLSPVPESLLAEAMELTGGLSVHDDEVIPDDVTF